MAAIVQTPQDKAGISPNAVEVTGVTNNVFMIQLGSIHIGMGAGLPNGEILYVAQADQVRTNNVLNGVEAGSLWINTETSSADMGQIFCNDGGTSKTSTDWTVIGTNMS